MMPQLRIYHNPRCSKSRQTLALLQERQLEPEIIEYLKTPPSIDEIKELLSWLNCPASALIRSKETEFKALGLENADENSLIEAMATHPALIERPIVVKGERAVLGRPPENVLELIA